MYYIILASLMWVLFGMMFAFALVSIAERKWRWVAYFVFWCLFDAGFAMHDISKIPITNVTEQAQISDVESAEKIAE